MFRFYSALSPQGTPERAALLAALPIDHEWEFDEEQNYWYLRIYNLLSVTEPVFCATTDRLFIHENGIIYFLLFPERTDFLKFGIEIWKQKETARGFLTMILPDRHSAPNTWLAAGGKPVDLLHLDKELFFVRKDGRIQLQILKFGMRNDQIFAVVPVRFLEFLARKAHIIGNLALINNAGPTRGLITLSVAGLEFGADVELPAKFDFRHGRTPLFIGDAVLSVPLTLSE